MADKEPLLFRHALGALRPLSHAAQTALHDMPQGAAVRIDIKPLTGNVKRMASYWMMLKIAIDHLPDAFDGPVSAAALHRWLKREGGLAKPIRSKPTGDIIDWDYDSISFATMSDQERSAFVEWATILLSRRLGVDADMLRTEAAEAASETVQAA